MFLPRFRKHEQIKEEQGRLRKQRSKKKYIAMEHTQDMEKIFLKENKSRKGRKNYMLCILLLRGLFQSYNLNIHVLRKKRVVLWLFLTYIFSNELSIAVLKNIGRVNDWVAAVYFPFSWFRCLDPVDEYYDYGACWLSTRKIDPTKSSWLELTLTYLERTLLLLMLVSHTPYFMYV